MVAVIAPSTGDFLGVDVIQFGVIKPAAGDIARHHFALQIIDVATKRLASLTRTRVANDPHFDNGALW